MAGETVEICFGATPLTLRFITAFKDGVCVKAASIDGNNLNLKSYVVPDGVDSVVFSYTKQSAVATVRRTVYGVSPALLDTVTIADANKLYYGNGSGAQEVSKNNSIVANADVLMAGEYLKLETNHIMNEKTLSISFKIDSLGEGDMIKLGHGEGLRGASYIELTSTTIKSYNYVNADTHAQGGDVMLNAAHGLTLSGVVNITVTTRLYDADITVTSSSGSYTKTGVTWDGRNGDIFAVSVGSDITDVRMRWYCAAYDYDVWVLGDSYLSSLSSWRWPYYLRLAGYSEYLLAGYSGRKSAAGLEDFKQALTHGTPKYAVWCLGMNDGDGSDSINASYLESVQEFIRICEANGITPILSTTPCTPTVNNYYKNRWVKNSGYRYIDFARAVGAEEMGSEWYEGMLHADQVHPTALGAKAFYGQVIADLPEILKK